ncbi:MAG TPA: NUDIX domain-containing protein [Patescibacteria group bacterium]|nr:NUDIX domain-containing protein [Patescibacteria group bacterium]
MSDKPKPGVGVGIMILKDQKVLLGQRHFDPTKADSELHGEGTWTMPGGKLRFGEKLIEAVSREVLEETGLVVNPKKIKIISLTDDIVKDKHYVTVGFLCGDFSGEARVNESEEITRWAWFSLDNLPTPLYPASEKIIKNFLAKEIYKN